MTNNPNLYKMRIKNTKMLLWLSMLSVITFITACKVDYDFNFSDVKVDLEAKPGFVIHVGTATFKLSNLIEARPDTLEFVGTDSIITIVYTDSSIAKYSVEEVFPTPEFPQFDPQEMKFDNIELGNISASTKVVLNELIDNMAAQSGGAIDADLIKSTKFFPPVPFGFPGGDYQYGEFDSIEYITFADGVFEITADNQTPIGFSEIVLELVNIDDNSLVGTITFYDLTSYSKQVKTLSMVDKTMKKNVVARLANIITTGGTFNSLTDEYLAFNVDNITPLIVKEGSVIIPEQTFNDTTNVDFTPPVADAEIKLIKLKTGLFNINFESSVSTPIELSLSIPSVLDASNNEYSMNTVINSGDQPLAIDLADKTIDLTLGGTVKNLVRVIYQAKVGGTGEYVLIKSPMSAKIGGTITSLNFDYVTGYFGTVEPYLIPEDEFDLLDKSFDAFDGQFKLTNPIIRMEVDNSFGIGASLDLNLTGKKGAESVTLQFDQDPLQLLPATVMYQSKKTVIALDKDFTNNTIVDLMALLPEKIVYSGSASVISSKTADNFVTSKSGINIGIFVNTPLEFNAKNVAYTDTIAFDSISNDIVGRAKIIIKTKNYFPFQIATRLLLYNSDQDRVLDSIIIKDANGKNLLFQAAAQNGNTVVPGENTVTFELTTKALEALAKTDKIILQGVLNTYNSSSGLGVLLKANTKMELDLSIATEVSLNSDDL